MVIFISVSLTLSYMYLVCFALLCFWVCLLCPSAGPERGMATQDLGDHSYACCSCSCSRSRSILICFGFIQIMLLLLLLFLLRLVLNSSSVT